MMGENDVSLWMVLQGYLLLHPLPPALFGALIVVRFSSRSFSCGNNEGQMMLTEASGEQLTVPPAEGRLGLLFGPSRFVSKRKDRGMRMSRSTLHTGNLPMCNRRTLMLDRLKSPSARERGWTTYSELVHQQCHVSKRQKD